jgi:hypothetical protein
VDIPGWAWVVDIPGGVGQREAAWVVDIPGGVGQREAAWVVDIPGGVGQWGSVRQHGQWMSLVGWVGVRWARSHHEGNAPCPSPPRIITDKIQNRINSCCYLTLSKNVFRPQ